MPSNLTVVDGRPVYREGADTHVVAWKIRQGNEWGPFLIPWDDLRPDTTRFELHRSVDGGQTWELVLETATPTSLTDYQGLSSGDTTYRLVAYTNAGAASETIVVLPAESAGLWLGHGEGYSSTVAARRSPNTTETQALAHQDFYHFAGQDQPTEISGTETSRTVQATAKLLPERLGTGEATAPDFLTLPKSDVLYRDPTGRRIYGGITALSAAEGSDGVSQLAFTVREATRDDEGVDYGGY